MTHLNYDMKAKARSDSASLSKSHLGNIQINLHIQGIGMNYLDPADLDKLISFLVDVQSTANRLAAMEVPGEI